MKEEIHRIEKIVFLEHPLFLSDKIPDKKDKAFPYRYEKVPYETYEDKKSILFQSFFSHM